MANDQTSKVSRCRDKGISGKTLHRVPLLFLFAVLLLPVISQASAQEALAAGNLTAGTQAASAKTPVPYVDSAGKAHECTEYTNTSALGSGEWTLRAGWYVLDQSATSSSGIRVTGDVNLILCDGNTLNTTRVLVDDDNILRIWAQKNGTGKLKATGVKNYAGIGSGEGRSCGYVVINGGSIEAHGGTNGAGIGGGKKGGGGSVTINGGTVSAYGAESDAWFAASGAAGIGGGRDGRGDTVQIRGGKVYAKGAEAAAGIGGGGDADPSTSNSGYGGSVYITGGKVEAYGGTYGAGIGGGFGGGYGTISITGGIVKAEAGVVGKDVTNDAGAAGIGGGHAQKTPGNLIEITGGNIDAIGRGGAGIGGGSGCSGGTIKISGGTVEAISGVDKHRCNGAGIGGGVAGSGGTITISGGYVAGLATGAGAGIGGGSTGSGGTITISGGLVFAVADWNRFDSENYMKSNHYKKHSSWADIVPILFDAAMTNLVNIAVSDQEAGAGIGGGNRGNGGTVRIEGGSVFAMSGLDNVPAIGRGINGGNDGSLYLYDTATVTAGSTVGSGNNAQLKAERQPKSNRVSACQQKRYAAITLCSHDDTQFIDYNSPDNHKAGSCKWCEVDAETLLPHEFDSETHTCKCGHKQYKLTLNQTGDGSVFLSSVKDAMKNGDSTWISEGRSFMTTVRPNSSKDVATITATYGPNAQPLTPEKESYAIDQDIAENIGRRVSWRSDKMPKGDVELTVDISQGVTISFDKGDSNASSFMNSVTWKPGKEYTIPENLFYAPHGKQFAGWKITADDPSWNPSDKVWQPGDKLAVPTDITLTAQWKWKDPYKVWVGNKQVSESNKDDILEDGGSITYNPETCTLTLKEGTKDIPNLHNGALIYAEDLDLTVTGPATETPGTEVVAAAGNAQYGIYVCGTYSQSLTVKGRIKVGNVIEYGLYAEDYIYIQENDTNTTRIEASGATPIFSERRIRLGSTPNNALVVTEPSGGKLSQSKQYIVESSGRTADHVVIENRNHTCDWEVSEVIEPTCTSEGVRIYTCKLDPGHIKEEPIPVVDHQEGGLEKVTIIDATCEDPGYYYAVHLCSVCNGVIDVSLDSEAPLPHLWGDWFVIKPSTCATNGEEARFCERTYDHFEVRDTDLDPTAHEWTEPTYTWAPNDSSVTVERHCEGCGAEEKETVKTSSQVTKAPTETEPGEVTMSATFENPAFSTQTKTVAIAPTGEALYKYVSGSGSTWHKGSGEPCTFTLKRTVNDETSFDHFLGILVDGKEVGQENYTASRGSVIIELKPAFLETLSPGWHTITAVFDDSPDVTALFNIDAGSSNAGNSNKSSEKTSSAKSSSSTSAKTSPKTGDGTPVIFVALLTLTAGALLLLANKKRREL